MAWRAGAAARRQLVWFNRTGERTGVWGGADDSVLAYAELSPDSRRVAVTRGVIGTADIWLMDGVRSTGFTFDPADDRYPIWSPDGARVAFASGRTGPFDLYAKAAEGSGAEQLLLASADTKRPNSWSPDGRFLLCYSVQNNGDLMILPLETEHAL